MKRVMNYRDRLPINADRALLLGTNASNRSSPSAASGDDAIRNEQSHQMFEQENDQRVNALSDKVSALKSLTINIGDEVRDQNRLLSSMEGDFMDTGGLLDGTMRRLSSMANAGHHNFICYLVLFVLFVFFVIYYLIR